MIRVIAPGRVYEQNLQDVKFIKNPNSTLILNSIPNLTFDHGGKK